ASKRIIGSPRAEGRLDIEEPRPDRARCVRLVPRCRRCRPRSPALGNRLVVLGEAGPWGSWYLRAVESPRRVLGQGLVGPEPNRGAGRDLAFDQMAFNEFLSGVLGHRTCLVTLRVHQ